MVVYNTTQSQYSEPQVLFDQSASVPIRLARVICIFFMVYVHVNPGNAAFDPVNMGVSAFDMVRLTFVNSFGRASIALLSAISGYLAVFSLSRTGFFSFIRKRVSSLLIPLALWSAIFMGLAYLGNILSDGYLVKALRGPVTLERLPSLLLGLLEAPANFPLYFLRDIFVCSLCAPLLLWIWKKGLPAYVAVVAGLYSLGHVSLFLLTPNLLLFYALGIFFAYRGIPKFGKLGLGISAISLVGLGVFASFMSIATTKFSSESGWELELILTLIRFPAAILFWSMAVSLVNTPIEKQVAKLEPYIFFVFCGHLIALTLLWFVWQKVFGGYYDPAYPIFFVMSPFLAFAILMSGAWILNRIAPILFKPLNGGRVLK